MAGTNGWVWKSVWALNTPPKVKNFLRRACSNIRTTYTEKSCKQSLSVWCATNIEKRYAMLQLWECPLARNVWRLVSGKIQESKAYATNFFPFDAKHVGEATKTRDGAMDDCFMGNMKGT